MVANNKLIAVLFALVVAISGCATSGNASLTNQASVDSIQINKTTKDDIARMFGAPSGKSTSAAGETWSYNYTSMKMIPFFTQADIRQLTVVFDKKGIVTNYTTTKDGI